MLDGVLAFPKVFSPFVSPCTPSCFLLLFGLSPLVSLLVSLCWMVCPPSRGSSLPLSPIAHCTPLLDGVPLLVSLCWMACPPSRGFCLRLSPIAPLLVFPCWMVRPPFRGSCLPSLRLYLFFFLFVGCCAPSCFPLLDGASAFRRVLSPFLSHCTSSYFPLLDGASAFPRVSSPFVCHCAPLLDGVSAFPRVWSSFNCLPWFPLAGWCVRLLEGLVSLCLPLCPFLFPFVGWCVHVSEGLVSPLFPLCWMVCSPCRRSCLPLSPIGPLNVSPCWMVCPPCRGSGLPLSPIVCPFLFPLVGWCVRLADGLVSLVSHCTP